MKFKRGDVVAVRQDGYWNMQLPQEIGVFGIVLHTYEGTEPSYRILVGAERKWVYEEDLADISL